MYEELFPGGAPLRLEETHVSTKSSIGLGQLLHFGWFKVCLIGSFSPRISLLQHHRPLFIGLLVYLVRFIVLMGFGMKGVSLVHVNVGPLLHPELFFRDYASFYVHAHSLLLNITVGIQKTKWRRAKRIRNTKKSLSCTRKTPPNLLSWHLAHFIGLITGYK